MSTFNPKFDVAGKAVFASFKLTGADDDKIIEIMTDNPIWAVYFDAAYLAEYKASKVQAVFDASPSKAEILTLCNTYRDSQVVDNKAQETLANVKAAYDAAMLANKAANDAKLAGYDVTSDGKLVKAAAYVGPAKEHKTRETGSRVKPVYGGREFASKSKAIEFCKESGWLKPGQFEVMKNNAFTGYYAPDDKLDKIFADNGMARG
jgi:hypothetical protein